MFQKFFEDTLCGRFIKGLLSETRLPIYECVIEGDYIHEANLYFYKDHIITCTKSGPLVDYQSTDVNSTRNFKILSVFDSQDKQNSFSYIPKSNYYDSETHYYLGKYLRYLRSSKGINLFPYYNCYCAHSIPDMMLVEGAGKSVIKQTAKVIGFPIQLNKHYKIAIDCNTPIELRCVVRNNSGFVLDELVGINLSNTYTTIDRCSFKTPFDYSVFIDSFDTDMQKHVLAQQKNLWLIIQLPKQNTSSIVIYEDISIRYNNSVLSTPPNVVLNPSLTFFNTHENYAFSFRLIEYLTNNVISCADTNTTNIRKVQEAISNSSFDYVSKHEGRKIHYGLWENLIRDSIYNAVSEFSNNNFLLDQDGNINKDVEQYILLQKGANY